MRWLAFPLLTLALAGCGSSSGVYRYERPAALYTGYALSTTELVGVLHSPRVGTVVHVITSRGRQEAVVVRIAGDAVIFEGLHEPLDIRPGDSGAALVGVLNGRTPESPPAALTALEGR